MSESRHRSSQNTANPREVACLLGVRTMIAFIFSTLSLKWPSGRFVRQSMLDLTAVIKLWFFFWIFSYFCGDDSPVSCYQTWVVPRGRWHCVSVLRLNLEHREWSITPRHCALVCSRSLGRGGEMCFLSTKCKRGKENEVLSWSWHFQ